ncbi:unnamed protein product, partial [Ectocarpus fasciculatus]
SLVGHDNTVRGLSWRSKHHPLVHGASARKVSSYAMSRILYLELVLRRRWGAFVEHNDIFIVFPSPPPRRNGIFVFFVSAKVRENKNKIGCCCCRHETHCH